MARLISFAAEDDRIGPIMRTPEYSFRTGGERRRVSPSAARIRFSVTGDMDVLGGKTGFISKAGYCLATLLKMPRADRRSPSSCWARPRTSAASGKRVTCSTWLSERTGSRPRYSGLVCRSQVSRFRLHRIRRYGATVRSRKGVLFVFRPSRRREMRRSALIAALDGGSIQRQRRDGIDRQQHRTAAVTAVEGLQVAAADVARVDAIPPVAARERRDAAAIAGSRSKGRRWRRSATGRCSGRR